MKRLVIALAVGATMLTGCTTAGTQTDRFDVKEVGGATCIVYQPYDGTGDGVQMQCDFGHAK